MPDGRMVSPGEFAAASAASMQINSFPRRIGKWFDWSLVAAVAVSALWIRKWRPLLSVILVVVALCDCVLGSWWAFRNGQILLPAVLPVGLALWVLLLRLVARRIEKIIVF
jgi:hypothetical protein